MASRLQSRQETRPVAYKNAVESSLKFNPIHSRRGIMSLTFGRRRGLGNWLFTLLIVALVAMGVWNYHQEIWKRLQAWNMPAAAPILAPAAKAVVPAPVPAAVPVQLVGDKGAKTPEFTAKPVTADPKGDSAKVPSVPDKAKTGQRADSPKAKTTNKSVVATAALPMAIHGQIPTPTELAKRVRESLKKDPSGYARVRGANATPADFLAAMTKAGAKVEGVQALPVYLESLIQREMPQGSITMSRMIYTKHANGTETFRLDTEKGFPREAHKGERGWYDANTGLLTLAGDCTNSPLRPREGPVAPTPAPVISQPAPPPVSATVRPTPPPPPELMPLGKVPEVIGCCTK